MLGYSIGVAMPSPRSCVLYVSHTDVHHSAFLRSMFACPNQFTNPGKFCQTYFSLLHSIYTRTRKNTDGSRD